MSARRISFFTALFLLGNIGAQDPSYPQVMRQLYGTYKMEELPFAKPAHRPDGWVLVLQEYTEKGPVPVAEHALWKPGDQRWRRLPVPRRERPVFDEDSLKELGMRLDEAYRYERCRYYGYPQWSWDVIRKFGQKPDLNAALLESLARACAEYGMGFMMPHQWGAPANPNWPGRQGWTGKASKLQADSFEHYARLEVATLQRLIRIDPNYEVLVGHVRQKLANEYVYFAQTLIQAGHDDRAMYWAKQAQYDASMLDWSYNLLAGLPQDAILISGGDNDTYPLWYLQLCRNIRRDVTVINLSLLGLKEYRDMLSSGNSMLGKAAFNAYEQHREEEERYFISLGSRGTADARILLETYYSGEENPELNAHSFVLDSGLNQIGGLDDFITDRYNAIDPGAQPVDRAGHGTQMALVASGSVLPGGAADGFAGAPIVAIRAFDDNGTTSNFTIMRAIERAAEQKARVINMSWGSETSSEFLRDAIELAQSRGMIVVASSGNKPTGRPVYPAAYPGVISTSALESDGTPWSESNYGTTVRVAAPGTADFPVGHKGPPGSYAGTSISSAYVSRLLALYVSRHPDATPASVRTALEKSLSPLGPESGQYGKGKLDEDALNRLFGSAEK